MFRWNQHAPVGLFAAVARGLQNQGAVVAQPLATRAQRVQRSGQMFEQIEADDRIDLLFQEQLFHRSFADLDAKLSADEVDRGCPHFDAGDLYARRAQQIREATGRAAELKRTVTRGEIGQHPIQIVNGAI